METKYNIGDLRQRQALPLSAKVLLTKKRIREFYEHCGGKVYISFSGGKDSTVLLHIAREMYPQVKAVYCDTGLEFPEVKKHIESFDNVDVIHPKKTFDQVIDEYGWVFPSKEIAEIIESARRNAHWAVQRLEGHETNGEPSIYKQRHKKWKGLLDAPFKISQECCTIMKKKPFVQYEKQTGLKLIVGTMADEGALRSTSWLRYGCNIFDSKRMMSRPLSVWTGQDILQYIKENNIKIPSVYGDIVEKNGKLKTTERDRTGCMFCLIGCHLEKGDNRRFIQMKQTHPQIYKYCMEQLGMKEILDYVRNYCKRKEDLY